MPINELSSGLPEFLEEFADKTILFVGIGNVLKKDDGVGVFISENIAGNGKIMTLTAEVTIENYIGKINHLHPDRLVLIDCTDMQRTPGFYRMLRPAEIRDLTFNTHNISLKRLEELFEMPVWLMGIQPMRIDFGEFLTPPVKAAAIEIIDIINRNTRSH